MLKVKNKPIGTKTIFDNIVSRLDMAEPKKSLSLGIYEKKWKWKWKTEE